MKKLILALALSVPCILAQAQNAPAKKTTTTAKKAAAAKPAKPAKAAATTQPEEKKVVGMPKMKFEKMSVDFGKIKTGDSPSFTYKFKNVGDKPLQIELVSACDCTSTEHTISEVQPGEEGFVKATFVSTRAEKEDHKKPLHKTVTIILKQNHPVSGYPIVEEVSFDVFIED